MSENLTASLFSDYKDFGNRLESWFTDQLNKTQDLLDVNKKLTLKVQKLEKENQKKDQESKRIQTRLAEKITELEEQKKSNMQLEQNCNAKILASETETNKMCAEVKILESRFAEIVTERNKLEDSNKKLKLKVQNLKQNVKQMKLKNFGVSEEKNSKSQNENNTSKKHLAEKTIDENHDLTSSQTQFCKNDYEKLLQQVVADIKICGAELCWVRFSKVLFSDL